MYPIFIVFASPALAVDILSIFATGSPIMDVDFDSSAHTLSHFMLATGSGMDYVSLARADRQHKEGQTPCLEFEMDEWMHKTERL